ncbi:MULTISPECIES: hypothetical protein, partial [unclassified Streptomyces]|uniref:hypothetical protein n=1 Tax=Streptomyces sp. NPDC055082 TaxID=3365718 RepID=UPI0037D0E978
GDPEGSGLDQDAGAGTQLDAGSGDHGKTPGQSWTATRRGPGKYGAVGRSGGFGATMRGSRRQNRNKGEARASHPQRTIGARLVV